MHRQEHISINIYYNNIHILLFLHVTFGNLNKSGGYRRVHLAELAEAVNIYLVIQTESQF